MVIDKTIQEQEFKYGWCKTDHKDGKEIRKHFRKVDYINDEPYASKTKAMLKQLGLPMPKPEEVFRGTHHDLLFLDSHGVCLRIGPTDVEDLMNPGILQPLGWIENKDNMIKVAKKDIPFSLVIYQGIEQYDHFFEKNLRPDIEGNLEDFLKNTDQKTGDVGDSNNGVIRVTNNHGKEVAVPILLDSDNEWNNSSEELREKRKNIINEENKADINKAELILRTIQKAFNDVNGSDLWQKAFLVHQPLRNRFWSAFKDVKSLTDEPDKERLNEFWDMCASVVNKPKNVVMHRWVSYKNDNGINVFKREDIHVENLVLYKPWTKELDDMRVLPAKASDRVKNAISQIKTKTSILSKFTSSIKSTISKVKFTKSLTKPIEKNSSKLSEFVERSNGIGNTDLMQSIRDDDTKQFEQLINAGASLDTKNKNGQTALIIASENGREEFVKILIKENADLNSVGKHNNTALMVAASNGAIECLELLIKAGADLELKNDNGQTALGLAVISNRKEVAKVLIKAGADYSFLNNQQKEDYLDTITETIQQRQRNEFKKRKNPALAH